MCACRPVWVVKYRLLAEPDLERAAQTYRLVTTLPNPRQAPANQLAALYHEHWEIETAYDAIKTHMLGPRPVLGSKTPALMRQKIEGLMLAYYAVCCLVQAAEAALDSRSHMPSR